LLSALFGSKIEKELKALLERAPELEVRYRDGETFTVSRLLKIFRNRIVISGFAGKLQKPDLTVTVLLNGAQFNTRVIKRAYDSAGRWLFFCDMPEAIRPPSRPLQKQVLRGVGTVRALLSTNRGERSVEFPIWDCSVLGMTLINASGVEARAGVKLYQAMVHIGPMQPQLVDLMVVSSRKRNLGGKPQNALTCVFNREPRGLSDILAAAKSAAPRG